jgi:hypothetical protein
MSTNRLFNKFNWYYLAFVMIISAYLVVHGYRTLIIAFIIAYIVLYLKYFKNRFSFNAILGIGFLLFAFVILSNVKEFQHVISFMIDKSTYQAKAGSENMDRYMELSYFWNEYLKAPWEWIFGGGFSGNSSYGVHMFNIQNYGSRTYGQVNWVDLGFIGMSFMGGLVMVGLWVKLLIMCMRRVPEEYYYIGAYCLYMILSSLTLNAAFYGNNIVVQCLVFFLFLKVRSEYYYKSLNFKMKTLNIES